MSRERARSTSLYEAVLEEKKQIDQLYEKGYRITAVKESLSGDYVEFTRTNEKDETEKEELHILTADGRIYFSNLILEEQRAL